MGGAVSAGENNEELVDNLCYESYVVTPAVEAVFRMIDRADYMKFDNEDERIDAYDDRALRKGSLHLSAPCIYTKALEALKIEPGLSFLNVGSGTGYFSTMVGILLGPHGVSHGIEIYPENIEFAYEKLKEFKESSYWYDPMKFCDPLFVLGNGLLLSPANRQYDRIYCGAAVPLEHAYLLKNLLNIDGILVMPTEHQLEAVTRTGLTEWSVAVVMPSVTFAPLITPSAESPDKLTTIEISSQLMTLKERCRLSILSCITRENYSLITSLPLPSSLLLYISSGRDWEDPPTPPKKLCPISEEDIKQRPVNEIDQRRMFVVDDQQRYLLVNCRGAVLMQLPLRQSSDAEDDDHDQGYDMEEGNSQEEYEDQDDEFYDQSNQDEDEGEVLEGSMESLDQYS